jgi:hypothetical protein
MLMNGTESKKGSLQTIPLQDNSIENYRIWTYTKGLSITGTPGSSYSLYIDATYTDNTNLFGVSDPGFLGTNDWNKLEVFLSPTKPLKNVKLYLRNELNGLAYFDDVNMIKCSKNCSLTSNSISPMKIIVPFYFSPYTHRNSWDRVVNASSKVKIVGIVNPSNGPGTSVDAKYQDLFNNVLKSKIEIIGYVYSSFGNRNISLIKKDVDTWLNLYPNVLSGIFVDETSTSIQFFEFYKELFQYISSKGLTTQLNPGTFLNSRYLEISSSIMHFESTQTLWNSQTIPSFFSCNCPEIPSQVSDKNYKYKFVSIVHSCGSALEMKQSVNKANENNFGSIYLTDKSTNVYSDLPSYWDELVDHVASLNNVTVPTSTSCQNALTIWLFLISIIVLI